MSADNVSRSRDFLNKMGPSSDWSSGFDSLRSGWKKSKKLMVMTKKDDASLSTSPESSDSGGECIHKSGYLWRRGSNKQWKRRWFELTDTKLRWRDEARDDLVKLRPEIMENAISLYGVKDVNEISDGEARALLGADTQGRYLFDLEHVKPEAPTFILAGQSDIERSEWVLALRRQKARLPLKKQGVSFARLRQRFTQSDSRDDLPDALSSDASLTHNASNASLTSLPSASLASPAPSPSPLSASLPPSASAAFSPPHPLSASSSVDGLRSSEADSSGDESTDSDSTEADRSEDASLPKQQQVAQPPTQNQSHPTQYQSHSVQYQSHPIQNQHAHNNPQLNQNPHSHHPHHTPQGDSAEQPPRKPQKHDGMSFQKLLKSRPHGKKKKEKHGRHSSASLDADPSSMQLATSPPSLRRAFAALKPDSRDRSASVSSLSPSPSQDPSPSPPSSLSDLQQSSSFAEFHASLAQSPSPAAAPPSSSSSSPAPAPSPSSPSSSFTTNPPFSTAVHASNTTASSSASSPFSALSNFTSASTPLHLHPSATDPSPSRAPLSKAPLSFEFSTPDALARLHAAALRDGSGEAAAPPPHPGLDFDALHKAALGGLLALTYCLGLFGAHFLWPCLALAAFLALLGPRAAAFKRRVAAQCRRDAWRALLREQAALSERPHWLNALLRRMWAPRLSPLLQDAARALLGRLPPAEQLEITALRVGAAPPVVLALQPLGDGERAAMLVRYCGAPEGDLGADLLVRVPPLPAPVAVSLGGFSMDAVVEVEAEVEVGSGAGGAGVGGVGLRQGRVTLVRVCGLDFAVRLGAGVELSNADCVYQYLRAQLLLAIDAMCGVPAVFAQGQPGAQRAERIVVDAQPVIDDAAQQAQKFEAIVAQLMKHLPILVEQGLPPLETSEELPQHHHSKKREGVLKLLSKAMRPSDPSDL